MSCFVYTIILLLRIFPLAYTLSNGCPSTMCGDMEIKFPYNLESSSNSCRKAGLSANLSCSSTNETILILPSSESYIVTYIDYHSFAISIRLSSHSISCPWEKSARKIPDYSGSIFGVSMTNYLLVSCTTMISGKALQYFIPVTCLSGIGSNVYAIYEDWRVDTLPPSCTKLYSAEFKFFGSISSTQELTTVLLPVVENDTTTCSNCFLNGKNCGYDIVRYKIFCFIQDSHHEDSHKGSHLGVKGSHLGVKGIVIGTSLTIFLIAVLLVIYFMKKFSNEKKKRIKVEKFLATFKSTTLTRYSFANIKKITKKFKHKLGQGGFGIVYKGELTNGIPVAVKILVATKSNGEEFINEVATIGKIHHVNVVRLLGFCSEGTNKALVYEFMPNESLENFIFLGDLKKRHQLFNMEKLEEIAIGIAQGIDYLHQGCNQRIVHFDIKPHNILLDYNFNPKISDFGLAKLHSRDQSIVTISAARGTMGYILPEVYSRNFGPVSSKSDVYSYGMLLLEMIGRRKNVDPTIENLSEIYFPKWIYDKLVHSTNLGVAMEMESNEEIMNKLAIIALWCIQWNPIARPSMTTVVQMLTMNCENLEMPPKPFVPSSDQRT